MVLRVAENSHLIHKSKVERERKAELIQNGMSPPPVAHPQQSHTS